MKTYKEIYQHLIYEWNEDLIKKQLQNSSHYYLNHKDMPENVVCQRIYCDNFSQEFQDYFVEKFKQIWQNIKKDATDNYLIIPFKEIILKLNNSDFNNYKDFRNVFRYFKTK